VAAASLRPLGVQVAESQEITADRGFPWRASASFGEDAEGEL